jgi:DNA-directed RNA polymerase subunit beta'
MGTTLLIEDGAEVKKGQKVATWDPHSVPVLSETAGTIQFVDFEEDVSVKTETDRATGAKTLVVLPRPSRTSTRASRSATRTARWSTRTTSPKRPS